MPEYNYFLVVRTEGITETTAAPSDAVVSATYWHPADCAWQHIYHASIDLVIADVLEDTDWRLLQRVDLDGPYEHELIFSCHRSDFGDGVEAV